MKGYVQSAIMGMSKLVFHCNSYFDIRKSLFDHIENFKPDFITEPTDNQLKPILLHSPRQAAKFIKSAMLKRTNILYKWLYHKL